MKSPRGWKRKFEDPIPLPRGRQLVALEDAARYIQKRPKAEQQIEEWQTAVETLILVAESNGGPTMLARIVSLHNYNFRLALTGGGVVSWDQRFDRPVVLPNGKTLRTEDARLRILSLSKP